MRKVIVFIAASVDGFIATKDGDISFLDSVAVDGEDYGYAEFIAGVDTVIMGRKTYEKVMSLVEVFPHADKEAYIITRQNLPSSEKLTFYNGDLNELIRDLKVRPGKNIFIDGGAEIVNLLLQLNLVDEIVISLIPVLLGDGIRLFDQKGFGVKLRLKDSKYYKSGLVQLHYSVVY